MIYRWKFRRSHQFNVLNGNFNKTVIFVEMAISAVGSRFFLKWNALILISIFYRREFGIKEWKIANKMVSTAESIMEMEQTSQ